MNRRPIVAGQFYPADVQGLERLVLECARGAGEPDAEPTMLAMTPHAGYVFSGPVAGKTIAQANLPDTIVLLGPNHTGMGSPMAVWPEGTWELPGGGVEVDAELAAYLIDKVDGFESDSRAHEREHSLEVVLPFLRHFNNNVRVVPVAVAERDPRRLLRAGEQLAEALRGSGRDAAMVVSSDMSHQLPQEEAKRRDSLAIDKILEFDPEGLYRTVAENDITMCGVLPMTLAMRAARELGAENARLVEYRTSAEASGDYSHVVGYAGVILN
ncbi:AmmeMemoRadiSam system protein B [Desulfohalovibrio reitneri]|uniref:AmmeMemoRadiSam system protein B n=1 Tax=Desulfohalovibrio reitneri TaxID=1307759 RepID=UPI0004A74976|nr:AmmeMemoRadiSam system protein B [Desulfohalovibrio reitneri]